MVVVFGKGDDVEQVPAQDFVFSPSVEALSRLVPAANVKVGIGDDHRVGHFAEHAGHQVAEARRRVGARAHGAKVAGDPCHWIGADENSR